MRLSNATAIYAAPVPLRLVLALTFIWAGLGKFLHTVPVQGEQAALLANMEYNFPAPDATPQAADTEAATRDDASQPAPAETPSDAANPPALLALALQDESPEPAEPENQQAESPATPTFTAADFPEPVEVKSLYNLAVLTYTAAHPTTNEDGTTPPPIWPEWAARESWPITLAWVAASTELAAGILIGIGLLTRLSAFSIASIMLTAAWLTEFGPAIQAGDTFLGFLPKHGLWDIYAWRPLLWQFALFGAAIALALAGPGAFALDRVSSDLDEDDDDDDQDED